MTKSLQDCTDFVRSMFKLFLPKLQHSFLLLDLSFLLADKEYWVEWVSRRVLGILCLDPTQSSFPFIKQSTTLFKLLLFGAQLLLQSFKLLVPWFNFFAFFQVILPFCKYFVFRSCDFKLLLHKLSFSVLDLTQTSINWNHLFLSYSSIASGGRVWAKLWVNLASSSCHDMIFVRSLKHHDCMLLIRWLLTLTLLALSSCSVGWISRVHGRTLLETVAYSGVWSGILSHIWRGSRTCSTRLSASLFLIV